MSQSDGFKLIWDYPIVPLTVYGSSPFRMHTAKPVGNHPPDGFSAYFFNEFEMRALFPYRDEDGYLVLGRIYTAYQGRN